MVSCFKRSFKKLDTTEVIIVMISDVFQCGWTCSLSVGMLHCGSLVPSS